jgi:chemotaxis protein MotA
MWKTTLSGFLIAVVAILAAQWLEGTPLRLLLQPTAAAIVFGATLGAVMVQSNAQDLLGAIRLLKWLLQPEPEQSQALKHVHEWAKLAHRDGFLKLDGVAAQVANPWLRKGLEMVADNFEAERIRQALQRDLHEHEVRVRRAIKVWESAAGYAPTIGIIGSVLGLMHIMTGFEDTGAIGQGLASAFVATFYGLGLANLVCLPLANKFKTLLAMQVQGSLVYVDGLSFIAEKRHPRQILAALESTAQHKNLQGVGA